MIIFPLVLFLSRWLAFFSSCCITLSLVVLYSSANSDTIRQNSFGFVSCTLCSGMPSQRMNLWNRFMIRLCTIPSTIILSAQSARKSDILLRQRATEKLEINVLLLLLIRMECVFPSFCFQRMLLFAKIPLIRWWNME